MEVLEKPSPMLEALLADLEYEPEAVALPGVGTVSILTVDQLPLELLSLLEDAKAEISGRRVWPGSVLLAVAMGSPGSPINFKNSPNVLELGAGSGLAGMAAVHLGSG